MYYPTESEFIKKAHKGTLIPVYRELLGDMETPVSMFKRLERYSESGYLLESVEGGEHLGRYSFLGFSPSVILQSKNSRSNPLAKLKSYLAEYKSVPVHGLPRFYGGAVGYIGYNTVRFFEDIPQNNPDDLGLPDTYFMIADPLIIFDHLQHTIKIVVNVKIGENPKKAYREAVAKINKMSARIDKARVVPLMESCKKPAKVKVKSNFSKRDFKQSVLQAKRYIRRGDIIQAVLSQRFETKFDSEPFNIYRALRSVNPSPYMYYLKAKGFCIIGSSPEILARCDNGTVEVRPIAGTRPRGKTRKQDKSLEKDLLNDPKERAEHVMLVDLGRNDAGRVCRKGTVKVTDFMAIEKYSHVMHMVSNVTGKLSRGKDQFDVLSATFPAGTVSGAPKIRAMEIIDELENINRGPYAGAIGYFGFSGNLDSAITIRTIIVKDGTAYIQAGAGIVADSVPEREYQETVNKAKGMIEAIGLAKTF